MPEDAERLKREVRKILKDLPSEIFLSRIDKAIDGADGNPEELKKSVARVAGLVRLFIGASQAEQVKNRCLGIIGEG